MNDAYLNNEPLGKDYMIVVLTFISCFISCAKSLNFNF